MTSAFCWQNSISLCPVSFCTPRSNLPVTPGYSLDYLLLHSGPLLWQGHLFGVLVLEGLVGLQRTVQIQLLSFTGQGIDLDYCDTGWLALETDHSVIFETASKYCILDSFVDYEGYSISFKGFFPTVVDIMLN